MHWISDARRARRARSGERAAAEFPLAVTGFEHYMLEDDRAAHPMIFHLRAELDGPLVARRFDAAFRAALARHPLLCSALTGRLGGRSARVGWTDVAHAAPAVEWGALGDGWSDDTMRRLDLTHEAGVKLYVRTSAKRSVVLAKLHHASCDGTGGTRFLIDLLRAYHGAEDARPADAGDYAVPLARRSSCSVQSRGESGGRLVWLARLLAFFAARPGAVTPLDPAATDTTRAFPPSCRMVLSADELSALKAYARRTGATVNDVLLTALFGTLARWSRDRHVQIAMPVNLRAKHAPRTSAANVMSMEFLTRRRRAILRDGSLLASVTRETSRIKRHGWGWTMVRLLAGFGRVPGGVRALVRLNRVFPTAVLSNLGEPVGVHEVPRLRRLELLPPVRAKVAAAFGVVTLDDELTVTLRYDDAVLGAPQARALLGDLVAGLRALI